MKNMGASNITLRALTKEDAKISWKWRNEDSMRHFYAGHPFFINIEKEEAWIAKVASSDIPLAAFGVEEIKTNTLIGMVFLKDINLIHRNAEFAIFIGNETVKGKGYATEATLKALDFAFNNLNLNRVFLKVQEDNSSAIKLYQKCNFTQEGVLRKSVFKNGTYLDEVVMSVLKSEYK